MAKNPWVLPDGFDADTRKAIKALILALKKSGAKIPQDAYTQLRLGNIEAFMAYVDWEKIREGFGDLEQILTIAAQRNGKSTFTLGGVDAELLFNLIDERSVIYARERVGQLIVEITEQMREVVRETIAQAQSGQMTYQSAAIRLQSTIPLTSRDAGAVDKFIEKKFAKFMRDGLSEARARIKAQDMGAKYAAKLLESRTRTIARTEIIDASMSGRYIGWEAGVTAGQISNDSIKEWIAEPDACPICRELDGKLIGWNDEWQFPEGVTAGSSNRMPPAHPNCRCSVVILPPDYAENIFTPQSGGEMPESAEQFMKHMLGQHDQSSHARRKVAGVPDNIDLDGKRFDSAARRELGGKVLDFENTRQAEWDNLVAQRHNGKNWNELDYFEKEQARGYWKDVDELPSVQNAKAEVENHFLFKDAAALESVQGGKIGDYSFTTPYSPMEKFTRIASRTGQDERWDADAANRADKQLLNLVGGENPTVYGIGPDNKGVSVVGAADGLTRENILESGNQQWQEYLTTANPQIIMSTQSAQRVVSGERIKTIHETGTRPSRAGASDADYIDTRKVYENAAFGYNDSNPPSSRPVSGLLGSGEPYYENLDIYGGKNPAVINLKPSVKERTTFTYGDSLNGFEPPKSIISPPPRKYTSELVDAAVYNKATGKNYFADAKISAPEVQIHGGVSLDDIASVTFYGNPSPSVLGTLDRKNVPYTIEQRTTVGEG